MKNVTLSIPDDILRKSREYAKIKGTTLNQMIRDFLKKTVSSDQENFVEKINKSLHDLGIETKDLKINRDELYER